MTTAQLLIVCLTVLAVAGAAAGAWSQVRRDATSAELARERQRMEERAAAREAEAASAAARAARRGVGPPDGAVLGVHVGTQVIRGTRVLRDAEEADGWVVLDDASVHDGGKSTPLGGRQWLQGHGWTQEL